MSYNNSADNLEYYYDGANVDDGSDMEDDLLQLLDNAKRHSEEDTTINNNIVGRDRRRRRRRWWMKYLVSWYRKCSEGEEENAYKRKKKRKRMGNYNEVQVQVQVLGSGGGGRWGRALRNWRAAAVEMNYNKYNDGIGTSGSPPPVPYVSLHRHHMMKLDVDGNGGLSSSSYYGPIYLVT